MPSLVVTGSAGDVGARLLTMLVADPSIDRVIAVDRVVPAASARERTKVEYRAADLAEDDLRDIVAGADAIAHLAWIAPRHDDLGAGRGSVTATHRLLDAARDAGVRHFVFLSSATVYGAWPTNAVPLTERGAIRPNPGFP